MPNALNQYANRTNVTAADVLGTAAAVATGATLKVNGATPYRRGEYFRAELTVTNAAGPAVTPVSVVASAASGTNVNTGKLLHPPRVQTFVCVAELDGGGTLLRQYVWGQDLSGTPTGAGGVGGLLWMRSAGGSAQYAAYDGNGNVVGLVDGATGTVSAVCEYDPYGNTIRLTGTGTVARDNAFRFSTKRAEETTGLVLYEYRVYSPSLGRWPTTPTRRDFVAVAPATRCD